MDLAQLVEDHYRKNFKTLVKRMQFRTKTVWSAEDVVQEAYLRALKYSDTYIRGAPFDNWFSRILSNALKDFMRSERDYTSLDDLEEEEESIDCSSIPDNIKLEVKQAIRDLIPEHREIVELNLVYGYDMRQIVQITNQKYKTIDQTIQRFKKGLKEKYNT